jgi:tetratricopeptide (TPR) repeat protein
MIALVGRLRELFPIAWTDTRRGDPVLAVATLLGLLVRSWAFGSVPPGLNQDEASTAYDAFCLIHHGTDRHGFHLPVMLVSWGSGMYSLAAYVEAPFIGLFGLSVFAARLPFLLAGVAAIPLLFVLLRDTTDRLTARIGAILLAGCPWHIMVSRWGLDSNLLPFVFLVATVLLVRSLQRPILLVPACVTYSLSLYSYGTAYVVVPAFLLLVGIYAARKRPWPRAVAVTSGIAGAIVATPIVLYLLVNRFAWESIRTPFFSIPRLPGVPRYETMGNVNPFSPGFVPRALSNLKDAWKLFRSQDDGLIWNAMPDYGILYWFSSVFAVVGLAVLIECHVRGRFKHSYFLMSWCIAAVALTVFVPVNINRANIAMFPFVYCVAIAWRALWQHRPVAITLGLLFTFSVLGFVSSYFGPYPQRAAPAFFASFDDAVRYASARTDGEICITDRVSMPYIFALFANASDPRDFYRTVRYENPGAEFQDVASFSRFRFGFRNCSLSAKVFVVAREEEDRFAGDTFSAERFERYTVLTRPGPPVAPSQNTPNGGQLPPSPRRAAETRIPPAAPSSDPSASFVTLFGEQKYEEALGVALSLKAQQDLPDPSLLNNIGLCYYKLARYPEAEHAYIEAIKLRPEYDTAMDNLSLVYAKENRLDLAISFAEQALKLRPGDPSIGRHLATYRRLESDSSPVRQ